MPAISRKGDMSTGHGDWPPTAMSATPVSKTYFNGILAGVVDPACQFDQHTKVSSPYTVHPKENRYPSSGSTKTYIEGFAAARIGDPLSDGDAIAAGSPNTFVK